VKVIQNAEVVAFLVGAPLYQETLIDGTELVVTSEDAPILLGSGSFGDICPPTYAWPVPDVFKHDCPQCEAVVTWERTSDALVKPGQRVVAFVCRSCRVQSLSVWLRIVFLKRGPPLQ
jgi:hypothetical protein